EQFGVLIFVDGAIAAAGSSTSSAASPGDHDPDPTPSPTSTATENEANVPPSLRTRRGSITAGKTVPQLRPFLENGGTVLAIGSSTSLAYELGLPIKNQLSTSDKDGKERALPREKFYVPGSVLRVRVDPSQPLAWGLDENTDVMFATGSAAFRPFDAGNKGLRRVAWYD